MTNDVKKKYELNYDRAVQDLYDIRDKALAAGSFNAAISAQNSLLRVGGLIVDRKEVLFGKIDQMSREEVEGRLEQLLGGAMAKQLVKQKELEQKEKSEGKVYDDHSASRLVDKVGVDDSPDKSKKSNPI